MCPPFERADTQVGPYSSGLQTVTRRFENEPNSNPEAGEDIDERISVK